MVPCVCLQIYFTLDIFLKIKTIICAVYLQIQGKMEVLHTAKARHDWCGEGKLDLSVRLGESVEILRVENNPIGKWLARSASGNCEFQYPFQSVL